MFDIRPDTFGNAPKDPHERAKIFLNQADKLYTFIPGPSFRLKFLPVQENLPEPGFVLKNSLRAEILIRADAANYLQST